MKKATILVSLVMAAVICLSRVSLAANAYADVPTNHWAYSALQSLTEKGIVQGYPDGTFKGDKPLTRYEFVVAIARALDYLDKNPKQGDNADVKALIGSLKDEFAADLEEFNARLSDVEARVDKLEAQQKEAKAASDEQGKLLAKLSSVKYSGDFRFRVQEDHSDLGGERTRERIRFRWGFQVPIEPDLTFTMRFNTQRGIESVSGNQTLGGSYPPSSTGTDAAASIYLDQAYLKYTPVRFGGLSKHATVYAGIFPIFLDKSSQILWDDDLMFQGTGEQFVFGKKNNFGLNLVQNIAMEQSGGGLKNDTFMLGAQATAHDFLAKGLNGYVGYYHVTNMKGLALTVNNGNVIPGIDVNGDGTLDKNDALMNGVTLWNVGASYKWPLVKRYPLKLRGDWVRNVKADVNPLYATRYNIGSSDRDGYQVGFDLGELKAKGDWQFTYDYKKAGLNSVPADWADSDFLPTNVIGHKISLFYRFSKNTDIGYTGFFRRMLNLFDAVQPNDSQTHLLDVITRF